MNNITNLRPQWKKLLQMEALSADEQNKKIDLLTKAVVGLYVALGPDSTRSNPVLGVDGILECAAHIDQQFTRPDDCDCPVCAGAGAAEELARIPRDRPPGDFTLTIPE